MLKLIAVSQLPTLATMAYVATIDVFGDVDKLLVGGILVFLVVERTLTALKNRGIDIQQLSRQVDEMHHWCRKENPNTGIKAIYDAGDGDKLIVALEKITDRFERRHDKLDQLLSQQATMMGKICAVMEHMDEKQTQFVSMGCPNATNVERVLDKFVHQIERLKETQ